MSLNTQSLSYYVLDKDLEHYLIWKWIKMIIVVSHDIKVK